MLLYDLQFNGIFSSSCLSWRHFINDLIYSRECGTSVFRGMCGDSIAGDIIRLRRRRVGEGGDLVAGDINRLGARDERSGSDGEGAVTTELLAVTSRLLLLLCLLHLLQRHTLCLCEEVLRMRPDAVHGTIGGCGSSEDKSGV